jgi:hypothetical protein
MSVDKLLQLLSLLGGLVHQGLEVPHLFLDISEIFQRAC